MKLGLVLVDFRPTNQVDIFENCNSTLSDTEKIDY